MQHFLGQNTNFQICRLLENSREMIYDHFFCHLHGVNPLGEPLLAIVKTTKIMCADQQHNTIRVGQSLNSWVKLGGQHNASIDSILQPFSWVIQVEEESLELIMTEEQS